ncbi:MAG: class II aldolase/adducin family protein [Chitinophagaceae bacterium]|nr:class II aldolase/adducin family protein [Chitinophagaceae bacterium]
MSTTLDTKLMHPRDQIALVISRIYSMGLTTTSGGNVSVIDDEGNIWITPSGVDKGSLRPADIMCVQNDGSITGKHKPSSEFPFHKAIYKKRPDIKAVIHAHSPALVSFSIVRSIPNTNIIYQAKKVCGDIGYAPYALPGSEMLGDKIAVEFAKGFSAIIMENHGTVVGGSDLSDAFQRFETLEFCARTQIYGSQFGKPRFLSDDMIEEHNAQMQAEFPEMTEVSYPSLEREKRSEICNIVKRACQHGLMKSSYGTVSARWKGNDFLITPNGVPRWDLKEEDIVQVKDGYREPGKHPSLTAELHQEIYARNPQINSIILTQSPYLMAFAVTGVDINVRTIPESWIFLKDMPQLEFGVQFSNPADIVNRLSKDKPALLLQNECVIVVGDKLLQTFDYLEVAEFSAKSIVMSSSIGSMVPINDEQTEELRKAFLK